MQKITAYQWTNTTESSRLHHGHTTEIISCSVDTDCSEIPAAHRKHNASHSCSRDTNYSEITAAMWKHTAEVHTCSLDKSYSEIIAIKRTHTAEVTSG